MRDRGHGFSMAHLQLSYKPGYLKSNVHLRSGIIALWENTCLAFLSTGGREIKSQTGAKETVWRVKHLLYKCEDWSLGPRNLLVILSWGGKEAARLLILGLARDPASIYKVGSCRRHQIPVYSPHAWAHMHTHLNTCTHMHAHYVVSKLK